jgi:hypothetical protein
LYSEERFWEKFSREKGIKQNTKKSNESEREMYREESDLNSRESD